MSERLDDMAEPQIVGAEIVAPFADAVRLVDYEEGHLGPLQVFDRLGLAELLRSEEQIFDFALSGAGEAFANFGDPLRGIDRRGISRILLGYGIHLVLLQSDQWRDDHGRAGDQQTGDLIDRRLAGTGRLYDQRIAAVQYGGDSFALSGAQRFEAEPFASNPRDIGRSVLLLRHAPANLQLKPHCAKKRDHFCTVSRTGAVLAVPTCMTSGRSPVAALEGT